jgi:hypothetical protein
VKRSASNKSPEIDSLLADQLDNPGKRRLSFVALLMPLVGAVVSGLLYCFNAYFDLRGLSIRPVHIIILILWLTMIESLSNDRLIKLFPLIIGMNAGIVVGYIYNRGLFYGRLGILLPILLGGLLGSIFIIPGLRCKSVRGRSSPIGPLSRPIIWSISAISLVLAFRLFNVIARHDIPNEKRSLMIAGTEVHHLITGFFFATVILIIFFNQCQPKRSRSFLAGLLMICLALIADQLSYILMVPLTDEAFFSVFSVAGAILGGTWLIIRINFLKSGLFSKNVQ